MRYCAKATGKHAKNKKFCWYALAYSVKTRRYTGTYGAFNGLRDTWTFDDLTQQPTPETQEQHKQRERREQIKREREQADRVKQEANAAQRAKDAAAVIQRVLALRDAGAAGTASPYLANKQLAIYDSRDAFVLTGQQLLTAGVKQVKQWQDFKTLPFLVVTMRDAGGRVVSLQLVSDVKTAFHWNAERKQYEPTPDGKSKMFLSGGKARGAMLPLTAGGRAVADCRKLYLIEGYAKAIAARMAAEDDAAVICAFSVSNYENALDALLTAAAPETPLKRLRRNGLPQQAFVLVADNDKAGRESAEKLLAAYPFLTVTFADAPCKDADDLLRFGGVQEVREMLQRASRRLSDRYILLQPQQYLSDAEIPLQNGLQWLIGDTGLGKTEYVKRYAERHPDEMTILASPVTAICEQTHHDLTRRGAAHQTVMEGAEMRYDVAGLTITTYASLARKFNPNNALYPITQFTDEAHLLSSDVFRQADIARLYDLMPQMRRAVLMTATPHFTHCNGLQHAPRIFVRQIGRPLTPVRQLWYPASEFAVIQHFAQRGRLVVEMNSKKGMRKMQKLLERRGFRGVYLINADVKRLPTGAYRYIVEHETLPADCQILLTTKLAETGINIRDNDVATLLIFAPKPLEIHGRPTAVPLPHDIKQMSNRFRGTRPAVFLCLPDGVDREKDAAFDGGREYARLRRKAKRQRKEYQKDVAMGGLDMAKVVYEQSLRETTPRLLTFDATGECYISECGLDMGGCEKYGILIASCGAFRERELNAHGLRFDGNVAFEELTARTVLTAEEAQDFLQAAAETNAEMQAEFETDLSALTLKTDSALRRDQSEHAPRLLWLRKYFGRDDASAVLRKLGYEGMAFGRFKARVHALTGIWNKGRIASVERIVAFLERREFTGKEAAALLTAVFTADRVLRHELDDNWRDGGKRPLSEKRAISILRRFADIQSRHTAFGNVFRVTDRYPVETLYRAATGKELTKNEFFTQSIFAFFAPKNPVNRAKTPDTLRYIRNEKPMCQPEEALNDSLHGHSNGLLAEPAMELSEYARLQLAVFGKVFFDERAAIYEYDGGLPRAEAERRARAHVLAVSSRLN